MISALIGALRSLDTPAWLTSVGQRGGITRTHFKTAIVVSDSRVGKRCDGLEEGYDAGEEFPGGGGVLAIDNECNYS